MEPSAPQALWRLSGRPVRPLHSRRERRHTVDIAIIKSAARLILREHAKSSFHGPLLCLGVPDFYLTRRELRLALGEENADKDDSLVPAREFFEAIGISEMTNIDIPGSEHAPDLIHDLNRPFPPTLIGRFGLVVDPATTEHVFDVRAGLTNIVRALDIGGSVIHFVPIYSYNGGYFSINPSVLHDFYGANGFSDLRSYIVMYDRFRPFSGRSRCYPYGPVTAPRHALADHDQIRYSPHLLFFARRARALDEVVIPIQHEPEMTASRRFAGRALRRLLGRSLATYLAGRVRREIQLRRSRRLSFWI